MNRPAYQTFIVWLQKNGGILGGYPGGGEGTRPVLMATGLKPGPFLGQKILKYKPSFGQHSPRLVLKLFISNIEQIHIIVIAFVYL